MPRPGSQSGLGNTLTLSLCHQAQCLAERSRSAAKRNSDAVEASLPWNKCLGGRILALERIFQRKFHLPIICCRAGNRRRPGEINRNLTCASGQPEIRMVQQIEEFSPELQLLLFEDLEILPQNEIEIDQMRPPQISYLRVAVGVRRLLAGRERRRHERRLIEPAIQRLMTGIRALIILPLRRSVK